MLLSRILRPVIRYRHIVTVARHANVTYSFTEKGNLTMTEKSKDSVRQARYRTRERLKAMAAFAHATEIDVAWFGVNRDGEHMAFGYDGKPIELVVRTKAPSAEMARKPEDAPVDEVSVQRQKRVYAPKSWDASRWNKGRAQIIDEKMTKERAHEAAEYTKNITDKQRKHLLAVIDALPDTPDWYTLLPVADES